MPLILHTLSRPVSNPNILHGVLLYFNSIIHYIKLSSVFYLSFELKSVHFVLSSSRWILNLLSTNHSHKLAKSLFNWCSILWISLCWNVRPQSSAYKNKSEWMVWGISLTYSKIRSGPKIDPWGTAQEILDKSEKWLLMLTLNARSDKYDLNHATVFSVKPIASNLLRRISWFIASRPFEDQLVSFPWKVLYRKLLVFYHWRKRGRGRWNGFS